MAKAEDNNGTRDSGKIQDSTSRLPMVDLKTAVDVVAEIRERAVETAIMPAVAKALGYAHATSTPFYRRITAARLFGLLSSKSSLTQNAIDYIKPHDEGTKARVLSSAIMGIPFYGELVARYTGKKLNIELVANAIAKDCRLTDDCALICAKAFESSIIFAGMMAQDGSVQGPMASGVDAEQKETEVVQEYTKQNNDGKSQKQANSDTQEHSIFLDRDRSRSFSFTGPLEITRAEYERICKWLEFTMLITTEDKKEVRT
jgi:hypothetical protein